MKAVTGSVAPPASPLSSRKSAASYLCRLCWHQCVPFWRRHRSFNRHARFTCWTPSCSASGGYRSPIHFALFNSIYSGVYKYIYVYVYILETDGWVCPVRQYGMSHTDESYWRESEREDTLMGGCAPSLQKTGDGANPHQRASTPAVRPHSRWPHSVLPNLCWQLCAIRTSRRTAFLRRLWNFL